MIELVETGWHCKYTYEDDWVPYNGEPSRNMDCPNCDRRLSFITHDPDMWLFDCGHCHKGWAFARRRAIKISK